MEIGADEEIATTVSLKSFDEPKCLCLATAQGIAKKVNISEFRNAKAKGIIAIKLDEGDKVVSAILTEGNNELVFISKQGQALRFSENDIRVMGRAARGVTGLKLKANDELTYFGSLRR